MDDFEIIWDLDDDPDGNVQHIAEHGVTMDEVEEALSDPGASTRPSRSSGRSITFGETSDGAISQSCGRRPWTIPSPSTP